MKLNTYRKKRDFTKTAEPIGNGKKAKNIYSIQYHEARRTHYDLRLEYNGVLLSWAVPKGPSVDPLDKRLAVKVEDHPVEYANFEGVIPKGQYGAGTVKLWDNGTFVPKVDFAKGLKEGSLKFTLHGKKLNGDWALVRMNDEPNWLLIKEKIKATDKIPFKKIEFKRAKAVASLPQDSDYLYEVKYDGFRMAAFVSEKVTFFSRNQIDMTDKFASVASDLKKMIKGTAVLDGEMVVIKNGKTDFGAISRLENGDEACFVVFDLLALNGEDLRESPLSERRKTLENLFIDPPASIILSKTYSDGEALFDAVKKIGLEGIVCKKINESYLKGEWLKLKCRLRQEFVVCGYISKEKEISSLVLGLYRDTKLEYVGNVGIAGQKTVDILKNEFNGLYSDVPTLSIKKKDVHWLKPVLMAEVEFAEWTDSNRLRQPIFKGLRRDKDASTVRNEDPSAIFGVNITNPQKQIFPDPVVKKIDIALYYQWAAPLMLPYLKGRPITVVRCNGGIDKCFFKKHPGSDKSKLIYIDSVGDIIKEVQLGTVEFHVLCHQDPTSYLVFDLDPDENLSLNAVRQGVKDIISELDAFSLKSFIKLSGGKGYHIIVPIKSSELKTEFSEFAKSIAKLLEMKYPDKYTSNIKKNKRTGKIFIDWQRNTPAATVVAPFSLRARQGATVSLPISKSNVSELSPNRVNIFNAKKIYGKNPWKDFFK